MQWRRFTRIVEVAEYKKIDATDFTTFFLINRDFVFFYSITHIYYLMNFVCSLGAMRKYCFALFTDIHIYSIHRIHIEAYLICRNGFAQ